MIFGRSNTCDHEWERESERRSTFTYPYADEVDGEIQYIVDELLFIKEKCSDCDETRSREKTGKKYTIDLTPVEDDA